MLWALCFGELLNCFLIITTLFKCHLYVIKPLVFVFVLFLSGNHTGLPRLGSCDQPASAPGARDHRCATPHSVVSAWAVMTTVQS